RLEHRELALEISLASEESLNHVEVFLTGLRAHNLFRRDDLCLESGRSAVEAHPRSRPVAQFPQGRRDHREAMRNKLPSGSLKTADVPHCSFLGGWVNSTPFSFK